MERSLYIGKYRRIYQVFFWVFYLNKEWTFKRNDHVFSGKSLVLRYICLYGFTLVIAVLVLYLIAEIANVNPLFGYIVSIFCSTALNFYGLKYIVFRARSSITDLDKGAISRYSSFLVKTFGIEGELNYYFEREDSSKLL